jgi:aryl-alcohol dehydrogenase-like predicted oxidoreductase
MYPDIMFKALHGSLERTNLPKIDIWQLHGPSYFGFWPRLATICDGFVRAYKEGHIKAIGTCNLGIEKASITFTYFLFLPLVNIAYLNRSVMSPRTFARATYRMSRTRSSFHSCARTRGAQA